jgi:hypothetical protein
MAQKGGLCGRSRQNRHLELIRPCSWHLRRRRQTHSLIVEEEYLHLRGSGACRGAVSGRHHLGDVAGDGLYDVHTRY